MRVNAFEKYENKLKHQVCLMLIPSFCIKTIKVYQPCSWDQALKSGRGCDICEFWSLSCWFRSQSRQAKACLTGSCHSKPFLCGTLFLWIFWNSNFEFIYYIFKNIYICAEQRKWDRFCMTCMAKFSFKWTVPLRDTCLTILSAFFFNWRVTAIMLDLCKRACGVVLIEI